ncbi:hypothetical protein ZIOFF_000732 [Zingiber officinale]|uniref:K+ potassium transporter integral membrane domain-containing protein n=1 Tax=Zingiber officinale TaxID=94328 RepID=A0A8J5LRL1_ZINOF|nr:hypothetical protein ZIOFF_000732 [Zingiber officinale]
MFDLSLTVATYGAPDLIAVLVIGVISGLLGSFYNSVNKILRTYNIINEYALAVGLFWCLECNFGTSSSDVSNNPGETGNSLELSMSREQHKYVEVPIACAILVTLFALQHYGTHPVTFLFALIMVTWIVCINVIGVYNIFHWNPHVYQALSPYYMYKFLKKTQRGGWMSSGGILLRITGSKAMYANLGHFSQLSV